MRNPDAGTPRVVLLAGLILFLAACIVRAAHLPAEVARLQRTNSASFGALALWGDTLVVGEPYEKSNARGVNNPGTNNLFAAGAAHVFVRDGSNWVQQAYLKASNTEFGDRFGTAVAIWSNTIAVSASDEDSSTATNGNDNSAVDSGAVYVFVRNGTNWTQQAYIKASNPGGGPAGSIGGDNFGAAIALFGDTLVVGALFEDSSTAGINGRQNDEGALNSGAAYVFVREGTNWSQQAYLKASNTGTGDFFGVSVDISGETIVVGAALENSGVPGINTNGDDETKVDSGAAYVFVRDGTNWTQQAYLKASNPDGPDPGSSTVGDRFGWSVAIYGDTVVAGAEGEDSSATGVNGYQFDNSVRGSGAAYVFVRQGTNWTQQAYLKASNTDTYDLFGTRVDIFGDVVVVCAEQEESGSSGVNGNQEDNSMDDAGAIYVFMREGTNWIQSAYVKPSQPIPEAYFGSGLTLWGHRLAASAGQGAGNEVSVYMFAPLGALPRLEIIRDGSAYLVRGQVQPWETYQLQRATNVTGPWLTNAPVMSATGWFEIRDTNAPPEQAFYRIVPP